MSTFSPNLPFAEQFADDVESGQPDKVAAALRRARGLLPAERMALPQIDDGVFASYSDQPPWEVVQDFIWLVAHYPLFSPPLTQQDKLRLWLQAVLRTADGAAALQIAQYLRPTREPGADIEAAVRRIGRISQGGLDETAEQGAEYLIRNLLEQQDTSDRTADALRFWIGIPALERVLNHVKPLVPAERRAALGLGPS